MALARYVSKHSSAAVHPRSVWIDVVDPTFRNLCSIYMLVSICVETYTCRTIHRTTTLEYPALPLASWNMGSLTE
jgi:hypothetical protein